MYAVHIPGTSNAVSVSVGQILGVDTGSGAAQVSLSPAAVANCIGVVAGLIRNSVSAGTWSAYANVWQEWIGLLLWVGQVTDEGVVTVLLYFIGLN